MGTWNAWAGVREAIAGSTKDGAPLSPPTTRPVVSGNGRFVAFEARGSDVGCPDGIVVKELSTGAVECASTTPDGKPALNGGTSENGKPSAAFSYDPAISADGRTVAFTTNAANFVAGAKRPGSYQVFVKNLDTGAIALASTTTDGTEVNTTFPGVRLSADGRTVAFVSASAKLVPGDTNRRYDVFVKNLATGSLVRASLTPAGRQGSGAVIDFDLSADGRRVAFSAPYDAPRPDGPNAPTDVYVRDLAAKRTWRISPGAGLRSGEASISADGRRVVFVLFAKKAAGPHQALLAEVGSAALRRFSIAGGAVPDFKVGRVAISGDGATVAYGAGEGRGRPIVLVEVASGRRAVFDAAGALVARSLSQTGDVLTGSARNGVIKYWRRG